MPMKHTISVLVENEFGVLSRVSGLFSGRGFNIESLSVAPTLDPSVSRMTIVTRGDEQILEQITKQLNKLIDTIKVIDFTSQDYIEREMALIKVSAEEETRAEVLRIVDIFRAKVVDVTPRSYTVEITGAPAKVNAIIELLRPMGIKELVRSGPVVLGRGSKGWKVAE
jgi:acetolactate synthase I/III small subunit